MVSAGAGEFGAVRVMDEDPAVQDVGEGGGHVVRAAAAQHEVGELVVGLLGPAHRLAVRPDGLGGGVEVDERGPGLLQQPGPVDGDGRVVGQRGEQRHLPGGELAGCAVGGVQDSDDAAAQAQRYAEDRAEAVRTALSMVVVWWKRVSAA